MCSHVTLCCVQVVFPDGQQRECLVPLADLMNHASPSAAAHVVRYGSLSPYSGCLELHTQRACAAGHQLFLSYGQLDNLKLLLFYGFVLPGSPDGARFGVDFEVHCRQCVAFTRAFTARVMQKIYQC